MITLKIEKCICGGGGLLLCRPNKPYNMENMYVECIRCSGSQNSIKEWNEMKKRLVPDPRWVAPHQEER